MLAKRGAWSVLRTGASTFGANSASRLHSWSSAASLAALDPAPPFQIVAPVLRELPAVVPREQGIVVGAEPREPGSETRDSDKRTGRRLVVARRLRPIRAGTATPLRMATRRRAS